MTLEEHKRLFEAEQERLRQGERQAVPPPPPRHVKIYIPPDGRPFITHSAHVNGWLDVGATLKPWPVAEEAAPVPKPARPALPDAAPTEDEAEGEDESGAGAESDDLEALSRDELRDLFKVKFGQAAPGRTGKAKLIEQLREG